MELATRHMRVFTALTGILILSHQAYSQSLDFSQRLAQREAKLQGLKLHWQLEESSKLFARRDVGEPDGAEVVFDYDDQSWQHSADFFFARDDEEMVVTGEASSFDSGAKKVAKRRLVLLFSDRVAGVVNYTDLANPKTPYSAEFVSTSGFGAKSSNPLDASGVLLPQEYLFLAGFAPEGMYGMTWTYTSDGKGRTTAVGKNFGSDDLVLNSNLRNHWTVTVVYDERTLCPVSAQLVQEKDKEQAYVCRGFREVNGVHLPEEVTMTHLLGSEARPMFETSRTWRLVSVEDTGDVAFPVPKGTQIGDYRLDVEDMHLMLFPPKGAEPVLYEWTGVMPTLDQLRGIRAGAEVPKPVELPRWLLPTGLILVGSVWLGYAARKRVAKNPA